MTGRISFYDNTRGFGFINGEDGESVFFHNSNVSVTNGGTFRVKSISFL